MTQDDIRAKCYNATFDYIKVKKPKAILLEQVPHILSKKLKKKVFARWMAEFLGLKIIVLIFKFYFLNILKSMILRLKALKDSNGNPMYNIYVKILNARTYVPQNRKRLFIVALRRKYQKQPFSFPPERKKLLKFQSILDKKKIGGTRHLDSLMVKKHSKTYHQLPENQLVHIDQPFLVRTQDHYQSTPRKCCGGACSPSRRWEGTRRRRSGLHLSIERQS